MSAAYPVIAPTTAAVTTPAQFNAGEADMVTFAVTAALGAAETASILLFTTQNTTIPYFNNGVAAQLTNTVSSITLPGGFIYGVTKLATAGSTGVDVHIKPRSGVQ